MIGKRLIYGYEGTKNKVNTTLIEKKFIDIRLKLFICSINLLKKGKDEDAVFNRYKQIWMCSHFDRSGHREAEDFEMLEFIADPKLSDKLVKECLDDIILLVLDFAARY